MLLLPLMLSSCATIINGTNQDVSIKSNVQGARIYIDGKDYGETPGEIDLVRDKTYALEVRAPGYASYHQKLDGRLSAWWGCNLFIGGPIGLLLDLCVGSAWAFDDVEAILTPLGGASAKNTTSSSTTQQPQNNVVRARKKSKDSSSGAGPRSSKPMDGFFDTVLGDN